MAIEVRLPEISLIGPTIVSHEAGAGTLVEIGQIICKIDDGGTSRYAAAIELPAPSRGRLTWIARDDTPVAAGELLARTSPAE